MRQTRLGSVHGMWGKVITLAKRGIGASHRSLLDPLGSILWLSRLGALIPDLRLSIKARGLDV